MSEARWVLRLRSFQSALANLVAYAEEYRQRRFSLLEQAGLIQNYEVIWELGWKLMRDYLVESGVSLATLTPGTVTRAAFSTALIDEGDAWMEAMKLRNRLSHDYDQAHAAQAADEIVGRYVHLFTALSDKLERLAGDAD